MADAKSLAGEAIQTTYDPSRAPRHVLITGATSGLGRALAEGYAQGGRRLSISGRDKERLDSVAAGCRDAGADVNATILDVTDEQAMEKWIVECDQLQPIDILIANAGIGGAAVVPPKTGEDGALARHILSVNTLGIINTVTPVTPRMIARGRGHIVMVGSIQDSIGVPQSPIYCASKAAVQIYADGLRRLLYDQGVSVTLVRPGFIDTPMSRSLEMPRPFCWSAEHAADRVIAGISKRVGQITFPWPLRLLFGLQKFAPVWITDLVIKQTTRHGWSNAAGYSQEDDLG